MAIQTYELVDKHIRRLDSDLARFESEIQDKALSSRNQDEQAVGKSTPGSRKTQTLSIYKYFAEGRKKTKDVKGEKKKRSGNSSEEDSAGAVRGKKKKQKGTGSSTPGSGATSGAKAAAGEGLYHSLSFSVISLFY